MSIKTIIVSLFIYLLLSALGLLLGFVLGFMLCLPDGACASPTDSIVILGPFIVGVLAAYKITANYLLKSGPDKKTANKRSFLIGFILALVIAAILIFNWIII